MLKYIKIYGEPCGALRHKVHHRQSSYNVILRHFRVTVYAVRNQCFIDYECGSVALVTQHAMRRIVLSFVACLSVQSFPHYLVNGTPFEKMLLSVKCALRFSLQLLSDAFLSYKKNWAIYNHNVLKFSLKVPALLVNFQCKLNFSSQMLKKYSNIQFHENQSSESRVDPWGQTDTQVNEQTDMTKLTLFTILQMRLKGFQMRTH